MAFTYTPESVTVLRGKGFPKGSVTAPRDNISWQLRAKEDHQVTQNSHKKFIRKEKPRKVAVSAQSRSSRELSRRQFRQGFSGVGRTLQGGNF